MLPISTPPEQDAESVTDSLLRQEEDLDFGTPEVEDTETPQVTDGMALS